MSELLLVLPTHGPQRPGAETKRLPRMASKFNDDSLDSSDSFAD